MEKKTEFVQFEDRLSCAMGTIVNGDGVLSINKISANANDLPLIGGARQQYYPTTTAPSNAALQKVSDAR